MPPFGIADVRWCTRARFPRNASETGFSDCRYVCLTAVMLRPLADFAFRSQGYGLTETNSVAVGFGKP